MRSLTQLGSIGVLAIAVVLPGASSAADFDGRLFGGVDAGVAVPVGSLNHFADVGGVLSPFVGYKLFADKDLQLNLAPMFQAQFIGLPADTDICPTCVPSGANDENTFALAYHAGPRISVPYGPIEIYGTWMAGGISGLTSPSSINHTSWGFSTGAGVNYSLNDNLMIGAFGRFNRFYQRVHGADDVQYATGGLSVTFQQSPPAPPPAAPAVSEAAPQPAPVTKRKIVLRGVNFDFDKATIRPDAVPILEQACSRLKLESNIDVVAQGYTDSIGSDAYNLKLSERRANAVRDWLVKCGVSPARLSAKGYGKSNPVATNTTAEGRAQNRRTELVVTN